MHATPPEKEAMDDNIPRIPPRLGGAIEPSDRATIAKRVFQTPETPASVRYELRDPFAEVTYRGNMFDEIAAKAEQLGASRFTQVDAEGRRTIIEKQAGSWQERGPEVSHATVQSGPQPLASVLKLLQAPRHALRHPRQRRWTSTGSEPPGSRPSKPACRRDTSSSAPA